MNAHAVTGRGPRRGPGGWVRLSPSRPARRRHSGQGVGTAPRVTGTASAVVRGPIPPAPVVAPARRMRGPFMNNAGSGQPDRELVVAVVGSAKHAEGGSHVPQRLLPLRPFHAGPRHDARLLRETSSGSRRCAATSSRSRRAGRSATSSSIPGAISSSPSWRRAACRACRRTYDAGINRGLGVPSVFYHFAFEAGSEAGLDGEAQRAARQGRGRDGRGRPRLGQVHLLQGSERDPARVLLLHPQPERRTMPGCRTASSCPSAVWASRTRTRCSRGRTRGPRRILKCWRRPPGRSRPSRRISRKETNTPWHAPSRLPPPSSARITKAPAAKRSSTGCWPCWSGRSSRRWSSSRIRRWRSRRISPSASAPTTTSSSRPRCRRRPRAAAAPRGPGRRGCTSGSARRLREDLNTAVLTDATADGAGPPQDPPAGDQGPGWPRPRLRAVLLRGRRHRLPRVRRAGAGRRRDVPGPALPRDLPRLGSRRGNRPDRLQHADLALALDLNELCMRAGAYQNISSWSVSPRRGSRTAWSSSGELHHRPNGTDLARAATTGDELVAARLDVDRMMPTRKRWNFLGRRQPEHYDWSSRSPRMRPR